MSKAIAYSAELVTAITKQYLDGVSLEEIAKEAGKTVPMIRSKLVAEKVYIPKAKVSKVTGTAPVRKLALAEAISALLGAESTLVSLEKATKEELEFVVKAVTALIPADESAE